MRDTLSYTTVIDGQEVTVTRHQPSDGRGLTQRLDNDGNPKRRKVKHAPVDAQLHALDQLLESAQEQGEETVIAEVENRIAQRIRELTGA